MLRVLQKVKHAHGHPNLVCCHVGFFVDGRCFASVHHINSGTNPGAVRGVQGSAGPIAGAGLPVLALSYSVYWLIRRRRKVD
jgi:hypothetical protein